MVIIQFGQQFFFLNFLEFILFSPGKKLFVDNHTLNRWWCFQRGVLHITSFVTKDGAKQFFFRCWVSLPFWCNLTNQNIAFCHPGTQTDDTVFVEVFGSFLTNVWNIAGQFFFTQFCISDIQFKAFNVNRSKHIFFNHTLRKHDGIFEVVPLPWHEGYF